MSRLICLYGGTFDPDHQGHLKPLAELQQKLSADEVFVIPAAIPPHRSAPLASAEQRVDMLQLALQAYPDFTLDLRELERNGPSWTVTTLKSFKKQFKDDSLCLVMGTDSFTSLPTWYHWQEILELAHILVIERKDDKRHDCEEGSEKAIPFPDWAKPYLHDEISILRQQQSAVVMAFSLTAYAMSATEIRQKLHDDEDVVGLMSEEVISYIQRNHLYQK